MLLTVDIRTLVFKTAIWDFDGKRVSQPVSPVLNKPDYEEKT
jgi:hypothetical protein